MAGAESGLVLRQGGGKRASARCRDTRCLRRGGFGAQAKIHSNSLSQTTRSKFSVRHFTRYCGVSPSVATNRVTLHLPGRAWAFMRCGLKFSVWPILNLCADIGIPDKCSVKG